MRDLKQCLIDLLRSGGIPVGDNNNNNSSSAQHNLKSAGNKPKKLHEYTAADCNAAFLRKYHEQGVVGTGNVIYFNENLSMTSKYDMRQFPSARFPSTSCPMSSFSISGDSISPRSSRSGRVDAESERFEFSSDYDQMTTASIDRSNCCTGATASADAQLDSFCTLCTSTFSYNKCCRYCDNSLCGSKCNSERGSRSSRMSRTGNSRGKLQMSDYLSSLRLAIIGNKSNNSNINGNNNVFVVKIN